MIDKEYRIQKKRIIKIWDKWYKTLGMHWWRVDRYWERDYCEDSSSTLMITNSNWEYRTGSIRIYVPSCAEITDEHLEESMVHEFVHILMAPLQDLRDDQARQITEHTVVTLARSIIWSREAGNKDKM